MHQTQKFGFDSYGFGPQYLMKMIMLFNQRISLEFINRTENEYFIFKAKCQYKYPPKNKSKDPVQTFDILDDSKLKRIGF